jgi:hypothetical protein
MKCMIIPVRIGATRIVTKGFKKIWKPYQENIQYIHYCTAVVGTSHTTREVLQCDTRSLSGGDHHWFKRITREIRPATRDDDDDDDDNNNNKSCCCLQTCMTYTTAVCTVNNS